MWSRLTLALTFIAAPALTFGDPIGDARRDLAALSVRQQAVAERVGKNRGELSRLLGALELLGRDPPPALLVSPSDALAAARGAILISALTPELEARARRLTGEARDLAVLRRRLASAEGELFAAESALGERAGPDTTVSLEPPAARPPGGPGAAFAAPAKGALVTAFGARLAGGDRAEGVTIRTASGAAVESPAEVLVDYAGPLGGWGQVVILSAAGGYHIVLAGLGRILVTPGERLTRGAPLARMAQGGSGKLYFELRRGRQPIDPAPFTDLRDLGLKRKLL